MANKKVIDLETIFRFNAEGCDFLLKDCDKYLSNEENKIWFPAFEKMKLALLEFERIAHEKDLQHD